MSKMFESIMVVYISLQTQIFSLRDTTPCPIDSVFNETTKNCTECTAGYYGLGCKQACRFPNYGTGCQQKCHCTEKHCNHVQGCYINGTEQDRDSDPHEHAAVAIGISLLCGFLLLIVAFIIITKANRRFSAGLIRENAHYVGSVVAEHSVTTQSYPQTTLNSHSNPENNIYMLAAAIKYENVDVE